jgi:hypothetical protein
VAVRDDVAVLVLELAVIVAFVVVRLLVEVALLLKLVVVAVCAVTVKNWLQKDKPKKKNANGLLPTLFLKRFSDIG